MKIRCHTTLAVPSFQNSTVCEDHIILLSWQYILVTSLNFNGNSFMLSYICFQTDNRSAIFRCDYSLRKDLKLLGATVRPEPAWGGSQKDSSALQNLPRAASGWCDVQQNMHDCKFHYICVLGFRGYFNSFSTTGSFTTRFNFCFLKKNHGEFASFFSGARKIFFKNSEVVLQIWVYYAIPWYRETAVKVFRSVMAKKWPSSWKGF